MKKTAIALLLAACASTAFAGDDAPAPDYSTPTIFRFAHEYVKQKEAEKKTFNFAEVGQVRVKLSPTTRMLLNYLPFLAPLPGSRLIDLATFPDPFVLTHTQYAGTRPPMTDEEYRRLKDIGNP